MPTSEQRFGPYILGETIGRGNFAKVKMAVHEATGVKVALKIIPRKALEQDPRFETKVKRETRILRLLSHPHIMRLYDVIRTRTDIVLVLEYVGGGELFDLLARRGRLDEAAARSMFQQLVSGVRYCHSYNVAHRDLKPENIMLETGTNNVKIGDFGLSTSMQDGRLFSTSCGTPNYAAPEVISGRMYNGAEADAWSLGVVLFTMLCGRLPFDEDYVSVLFKKISRASYIIPGHVSAMASDLLQRLLVVNPLERATLDQVVNHPWLAPNYPPHLLRSHMDDPEALDAIDDTIAAEVARRLRQPLLNVMGKLSSYRERRGVSSEQNFKERSNSSFLSRSDSSFTRTNSTQDAPVPGDSDTHDIYIAYCVLRDRKAFNAVTANGSGGSLGAKSSHNDPAGQSLGAALATTDMTMPTSMSFGQSLGANNSLPSSTTKKSPSLNMPPLPNNASGVLPALPYGTTAAAYNATQAAPDGPKLLTKKPKVDVNLTTPTNATPASFPRSAGIQGPPKRTEPADQWLLLRPPADEEEEISPEVRPRSNAGSNVGSPTSRGGSTPLAGSPTGRVPQQALERYRIGVLVDRASAREAMSVAYRAMERTGLLWKPTHPFAVVAVSQSPPARIYVSVFRADHAPGHYLVDAWLSDACGFEAWDVMAEFYQRLLRAAEEPAVQKPPPSSEVTGSAALRQQDSNPVAAKPGTK